MDTNKKLITKERIYNAKSNKCSKATVSGHKINLFLACLFLPSPFLGSAHEPDQIILNGSNLTREI